MADIIDLENITKLRSVIAGILGDIDTFIDAVHSNNVEVAAESVKNVRKVLFSKTSFFDYKERIKLFNELTMVLEIIYAYKFEYLRNTSDVEELIKSMKDMHLTDIVKRKRESVELEEVKSAILNNSASNLDEVIDSLDLDDAVADVLEALDYDNNNDDNF